jgi:cytochrome c oxidase subunit 2
MFLSWLPDNVSSVGRDIDAILVLIYWITLAWFVLTIGVFLTFLVRYRRRAGRPAAHVRGEGFRQTAWVLLPCVLVLGLDLWIDFKGAPVWARVKLERPETDLAVKVTARQFNWVFTYPGPDGAFGTPDDRTLVDQFHIPAGRPVALTLESEDVIHSFFLPSLRIKQDVLPGRRLDAWIDAMTPGRYELPCAYLCGMGHTGMAAWLEVHAPEAWRQWVAAQWPEAGR